MSNIAASLAATANTELRVQRLAVEEAWCLAQNKWKDGLQKGRRAAWLERFNPVFCFDFQTGMIKFNHCYAK